MNNTMIQKLNKPVYKGNGKPEAIPLTDPRDMTHGDKEREYTHLSNRFGITVDEAAHAVDYIAPTDFAYFIQQTKGISFKQAVDVSHDFADMPKEVNDFYYVRELADIYHVNLARAIDVFSALPEGKEDRLEEVLLYSNKTGTDLTDIQVALNNYGASKTPILKVRVAPKNARIYRFADLNGAEAEEAWNLMVGGTSFDKEDLPWENEKTPMVRSELEELAETLSSRN